MIVLALVCGVAAAVGMNRLRQPTAAGEKAETVPVVVAVAEIGRGRMVQAKDLEVRDWPKDVAPAGALTTIERARDRVALVPISPGEAVFDNKLAAKDSGRGLAALVTKGMRAYTIQASRAASSVAGFILPGNKVDVLLNLKPSGNDDESGGGGTTTLLQAVEILAVDQALDAPADNKKDPKQLGSVTLLVTPEQAALLDLGQNMGNLSLSLRNADDKLAGKTRPATVNDIRFRQDRPIVQHKEASGPGALAEAFQAFLGMLAKMPAAKQREPEPCEIVTMRGTNRGHVLVVGYP
jgi:pilus assembly protein CpaB